MVQNYAAQLYSDLGADIVMESITLIEGRPALSRLNEGNCLITSNYP
jgi:hypothetical protein